MFPPIIHVNSNNSVLKLFAKIWENGDITKEVRSGNKHMQINR